MKKLMVLAFASLLSITAGSAIASIVVSNPPSPFSEWVPLGEPDTTTYGETFQVPDIANTRLDSFSFWLRSLSGTTSKLKGYVAEWNGVGINGPVLYSSTEVDGIYPTSTEVVFNTGGINLDPSKQYVAFLSAAGLFDGQSDAVGMGSTNVPDSYLGGSFVYDNSNGAFPGASWNGCVSSYNCQDLAFTLTFNQPSNNIPEPGALALLSIGLLGLTAARNRNKV